MTWNLHDKYMDIDFIYSNSERYNSSLILGVGFTFRKLASSLLYVFVYTCLFDGCLEMCKHVNGETFLKLHKRF